MHHYLFRKWKCQKNCWHRVCEWDGYLTGWCLCRVYWRLDEKNKSDSDLLCLPTQWLLAMWNAFVFVYLARRNEEFRLVCVVRRCVLVSCWNRIFYSGNLLSRRARSTNTNALAVHVTTYINKRSAANSSVSIHSSTLHCRSIVPKKIVLHFNVQYSQN